MTSIRNGSAFAAVLVLCVAAPAFADGFRDSHFGPDACYARLDHPDQEQVARPTRQAVTFSLIEDAGAGAELSSSEMALAMVASGRSGRQGRRLSATCEGGGDAFECVVGRDRGRFTLTPQGENIHMRIDEMNMPGDDGSRRGPTGVLSGRGEEKEFVLKRVDPGLCL